MRHWKKASGLRGGVGLVAAVVCLATMMWGARCAAEERHTWGVRAGYGQAFGTDETVQFASFLPYYRFSFLRFLGEDPGCVQLSLCVEGAFNVFFSPETAVGIGVIPMIRLDLLGGRIIPYLGAGVGPYYTNLDIVELGQEFNFLSQGELGMRFRVGARCSFHATYRIQHVSNAGMSERNAGVNSNLFLLGFSYHF